MKFQKPILNFELTDSHTHGQAQSNMPLQLFASWGHNDSNYNAMFIWKNLYVPHKKCDFKIILVSYDIKIQFNLRAPVYIIIH